MTTDDDRIIAAWAEHCSGPGWSNNLIWVLKCRVNGELHLESIQPDEQTSDMRVLFGVSDAVMRAMTAACSIGG